MSARDDAHRLVDSMPEDRLDDIVDVLRAMSEAEEPLSRHLSLIGVFRSGQGDLAARSSEILCRELGGEAAS
ncbi:hypothetical protein LX15_005123 [Streptoalloteichus tenebrarius]|uniref:Uncharacterized protein n=1 Tax=Streptoalloteichus tenebrarius (strain ATCC 17920 / DSM 40477 / JCM 4838 / CBS 697.72 / NBRC 16177 / NCIMB 11028 / NRRL B-12390 / A12253. 1 / ISP 5477) TaxID=1933 RepID=A0ABT1I0U6_STRSD|nr:hypothetical protein [Streptoalloteichus tenebrarius]MCP2261397.1 hypothetical protein [Streptoalloteichus tenebrarius]BFF02000.1 hypothetical protein GCM10020241_36750 [Streptoalloteichus tenebrarius]